ncbi:hypothetical protein PMAYCL1PPCAC_09013, partial [Pristionchus mayeri]
LFALAHLSVSAAVECYVGEYNIHPYISKVAHNCTGAKISDELCVKYVRRDGSKRLSCAPMKDCNIRYTNLSSQINKMWAHVFGYQRDWNWITTPMSTTFA